MATVLADVIKLNRATVSAVSSELVDGQIGFAYTDKTLVIKDTSGTVTEIKDTDGTIEQVLGTLSIKAPVANVASLPSVGNTAGDLIYVNSEAEYYLYTVSWDPLVNGGTQPFLYLDWDGTTPYTFVTQNQWYVFNFWQDDPTDESQVEYNNDGTYTFNLDEFEKMYRAVLNLQISATASSHTLEAGIQVKPAGGSWPALGTSASDAEQVKTFTVNTTGSSITQFTRAIINDAVSIRVVWRCTSGSNKTVSLQYGFKEVTRTS